MTTEAVELTCGVVIPHGARAVPGLCDLPIRQRASGPCVAKAGGCDAWGVATARIEVIEDKIQRHDEHADHRYDPGYDHVDLEGACRHVWIGKGYAEECRGGSSDDAHWIERYGTEDGYAHIFVPPVLPLPHEATV